jgi:hypothetical protein
MPAPEIYSDWKVAKKAAAALANAVGATLLQTGKSEKRIIHGPKVLTMPTWLACWSYLFRVRTDQIAAARLANTRRQATVGPTAHFWTPSSLFQYIPTQTTMDDGRRVIR